MNFSYYNENERHVTIKDYVVSGSWDLLDGPMSIEKSTFTPSISNETESSNSSASIMSARLEKADGRNRVEFVCTLTIKRKTLFYTVNLIIPTVNSYCFIYLNKIIDFLLFRCLFLFYQSSFFIYQQMQEKK